MRKKQNNKVVVAAIVVLGVIGTIPIVSAARNLGSKNQKGEGMMRQGILNNDSTPIGLGDEDGDGILNKDDDDFEGMGNGLGRSLNNQNNNTQRNVNRNTARGDERNNTAQRALSREQIRQNNNAVQNNQQRKNQIRNNQNVTSAQVRTMAQEQKTLELEINQDIKQIKQEKGIRKFLFGINKGVVQQAQTRLLRQEEKIQQMKSIVGEINDPQLQLTVQEQIVEMEKNRELLQSEIEQNKSGILSWIKNLFN